MDKCQNIYSTKYLNLQGGEEEEGGEALQRERNVDLLKENV